MINTLERLAIVVVAAASSLIFVYGTLSMAWAGCDDPMPPNTASQWEAIFGAALAPSAAEQTYPNHESTETYTLHIVTNGNLKQADDTFKTVEECEKEGAYREYKGKIRSFTCIPGRGPPAPMCTLEDNVTPCASEAVETVYMIATTSADMHQ